MSELPKNWISTTIGELALYVQRGKSPQYTSVSDLPVINQKCIRWHGLEKEHVKYIHPEQYGAWSDERYLRHGDILWNSTGTGTIGRACIYKDSYFPKAVADSHVTIVRFDPSHLCPEYAFYFIASPFVQKKIEEMQSGSTNQVELGRSAIVETSIPLPPLNEQKRIVAKIEELFSELDSGIESLKTARAQLKVYRQAVLKHAFEKFSERVALEAVSDAVGGYAFKSPSFKIDGGKYQVIRMGNLRPGLIREDESPVYLDEVDSKILERYLLKVDDVLITLTGTRNKRDYGYTAIVKKTNYLVNQRIAYLRFSPQYLPSFFLYYSWTEDFKRQFFGHETGNVGQGNVGMKAIRTTLIPKATIAEQKRVVDALDASFATIENVEITIETELQKSEALRQSILKKAFSGQLVAQDAKDESASALLTHIRVEKTAARPAAKKYKNKRNAA